MTTLRQYWEPYHVAQREAKEVQWAKLCTFLDKATEQRAALAKTRVLTAVKSDASL